MKQWRMLLLCLLMAVLVCMPALAAEQEVIAPAYTPSTALEARCVPLMLNQGVRDAETGEIPKWKLIYNPETAAMAVDLAKASASLDEPGVQGEWEAVMRAYGYEQLACTYNNVAYQEQKYSIGWRWLNEIMQPVWFPAVNAIIGIQDVVYNGKTRHAVAIVFRGTYDLQDAVTDITAYKDEEGYHEGFAQNAEYFYNTLSKEIEFQVGNRTYTLYDIYDEMKEQDSDFCMLVMGHSLGGALSNMLVGRYLYEHGVHPSNLGGYMLATPLNAPREKVNAYPYQNIYNIINDDDLVPVITLVGHERFGTDLLYRPDDEFRLSHYGREYVEAHLHERPAFWRWDGFIATVGNAHDNDVCYRDIVKLISSAIASSTRESGWRYTPYSTSGYNDWGSGDAIFSSYTFGNMLGELKLGGTLRFQGGVLLVGQNLEAGTSITMHNEDDYLLVNGNLDLSWGVTEKELPHLTAGTVEVKGDFRSGRYSFWENPYVETGTHRTVISGAPGQFVNLHGNTQLQNLCLRNSYVKFGCALTSVRLAENAEIIGMDALTIHNLDLNGYHLNLYGYDELKLGTLTMNGGNLSTAGDLIVKTVDQVDGPLVVQGNFETEKTLRFCAGQMWVGGNCYLPATMIMQNEEDYLQVGGNLTLFARDSDNIPDDHLCAGTVELKGNLTYDDMGVCHHNGYRESGTHRTILSGEGLQTVSMAAVYFMKHENRVLQACLRNPNVALYAVYTLRLMEDGSIADASKCEAEGELDLNGHKLAVMGKFKRLGRVTGGSEMVQMSVDNQTITVTRPTMEEADETIHVLFAGYDAARRLVICQEMTFASQSEMQQTLRLENWPECAEIQVFLLEEGYAPFCQKMQLEL